MHTRAQENPGFGDKILDIISNVEPPPEYWNSKHLK